MRAIRPLLIAAAVLAAVALVVGSILIFVAPRAGDLLPGAAEQPAPSWAPPADPPTAATPTNGVITWVDPAWVADASAATGIPERALAAYAGATLAKADAMPECGLSWNTLAAIAAVESDHGRHGGSSVGPDGTVSPPIYGIALDGSESEHIPDSDGGAIDGDSQYDRAVGPFQMIPQTWRNWGTDGNGDGINDPQNLDDEARAAANYLCRVSIGIDTESGWRAAISGYNSAPDYIDAVARYAVQYADAVSAG